MAWPPIAYCACVHLWRDHARNYKARELLSGSSFVHIVAIYLCFCVATSVFKQPSFSHFLLQDLLYVIRIAVMKLRMPLCPTVLLLPVYTIGYSTSMTCCPPEYPIYRPSPAVFAFKFYRPYFVTQTTNLASRSAVAAARCLYLLSCHILDLGNVFPASLNHLW